MLHNRIRRNHYSAGGTSRLMPAIIALMFFSYFLLFSSITYASEESSDSDDSVTDQIFATLLADEGTLQKNFLDENAQDGRILRFGVADVTGDGRKDLIVSKDEPGSKQNSDTCFYTIENGHPILIGVMKSDSLQKIGYHADSGYVYLYTEEQNGGQKVELFSFPEDIYDEETGGNNCEPFITFTMSPDKEGNLHCYIDEEELSEKQFVKEFIKYLGKPAPFYEDEYYFGWDGYELAAELENTPEERIQVFGSDGSTAILPETEAETEIETEMSEIVVETETEDTESVIVETEAQETEKELIETEINETGTEELKPKTEEAETEAVEINSVSIETEASTLETEAKAAKIETESPISETEIVETEAIVTETNVSGEAEPPTEGGGVWICPECGNEATGNFCGKCGTANPSPEWICPNCRETVTGNFCQNCGTARPEGQGAIAIDNAPENTEIQEVVPATNSWENNLLMEEHGALGALTADGNTAPANEYVFDNPDWRRSEVEGIYILNTKQNIPAYAVDVSGGKEGTVMAWLDEQNYLYIAGEGGVRVSDNASALFAWFENVKEIHLDGNLHTDYCTNMSHMFYHCHNLIDLNLDGINTENVVNMTKMFTACSSLRTLDVSQLSTSRVESFYATFQKCSSLEELNLTGFDTSMVNNMALMFADCSNLQSIILNVQSFKTDLVETMSYMFDGCEALYYVSLAGFDTHSVKRTNYMFRNCKSLEDLFLESHDFSSIEEHEGMFQGAYMEAYYGTNGETLFMSA